MAEGDISLAEAARRLDMAPNTLRRRMRTLKIEGCPVGGVKALNAKQFECIRAHDQSCYRPGRRRNINL